MGTQPTNNKKAGHSQGESSGMTAGTVLTDEISVGRTGREWHLPFHVTFDRSNVSQKSSAVRITKHPDEAQLIRATCTFLRDNAPAEYRLLHAYLGIHRPSMPSAPHERRTARDQVSPLPSSVEASHLVKHSAKELPDKAPFTIPIPEIDRGHWVYRRHYNPGNYTTAKSGDREKLSKWEAESDVQTITYYLEAYQKLADSVDGKRLWKATVTPAFRDPYETCMELCVGEAQVPSHFLSLIHYGIGLHMMYEQSLPWKKKDIPENISRDFIQAFKNSFEALAILYREDFCA